MNLGGPDSLTSVKPFLFNLFNDKAIITLPNPFRYILAWLISTFRNKKAQKIYGYLGGKSPILEQTIKQAFEITKYVTEKEKNIEFQSLVAMRYWKPRISEIINQVNDFKPEEIILLPLYPQFSTTTSGSAIDELESCLKENNLKVKVKILGCFPIEKTYVKAQINLIREKIKNIDKSEDKILFFSAHSLPQKIIDDGDPYKMQTEATALAIWEGLKEIENLQYKITYQSKVGYNKWLTPSSEEEITKAAKAGKTIIIYPISFVSEHSETLVELDIQYKELAQENGCKNYVRVPTAYIDQNFVKAVGDQILLLSERKTESKMSVFPANFKKICSANFIKCRCEE